MQKLTIENYQKGKFTEEEGRTKRYQFLKKVAKEKRMLIFAG